MTKNYMTAEKFEEEVSMIQARFDRFIKKANDLILKKVNGLYEQLSDEQKNRFQNRQKARIAQAQRKIQVVSPGSRRIQ